MITTVQVVWISVQLRIESVQTIKAPKQSNQKTHYTITVKKRSKPFMVLWTTDLEQSSRHQMPGSASSDMEHSNTAMQPHKCMTCYFGNIVVHS